MPSPEAIRAAELANAESKGCRVVEPYQYDENGLAERRAFARYIREVSDAVKAAREAGGGGADTWCLVDFAQLSRFILPDPVDPLLEALNGLVPEIGAPPGVPPAEHLATNLRQALASAGYEIRKVGE